MMMLSNGHSFEYMTASGAMAYDGKGWPQEKLLRFFGLIDIFLFTHVMKTITLLPRKGNFRWWKPWETVKPIWRGLKIVGTVNAFGLTNPGLDWFLQKVAPRICYTIPLVASVFSDSEDSPKELGITASKLGKFPFVGIEYNTSCPNAKHGIQKNVEKIAEGVDAIEQNCDLPRILKVSVAQDVEAIITAVKKKIQAISINSVPWNMIFPGRESPLAKFGGGGVSGKIAQPITWALAEELQSITDVPIIVPSMWDYKDIGNRRAKGFKAFSFGSVFLCKPWVPTYYVRKDQKEIRK